MASHEFRTPLSTILSSVGLMSRYVLANEPNKLQKHLDRIHASVHHLKNILDDFLSLSKLEEGRVGVNPEKFNIAKVATIVRDNMQSVAKPGQKIDCRNLEDGTWVTLDKMAIENIMINLLSNAIKYSPENTPIELVIQEDDKFVTIKVIDNGMGIPEAEQNHLFERFFRAKNAANIQGTGLGLNIVKRYVELMRGEISVESKEHKGTSIIVKLPTYFANESQPKPS
jgi:signal transduction histidine kinase